jgi:cytochrome P450
MELLTSLIHENMQRRIKEEEEIGEESENGRKDILHYLFYTKDIETGNPAFSKKELAIESSLILKGAIGTISNTISAFFFYITRNHHAYQKLTQELRTTFSSADDIKAGARLTSCLYLRACLDETLRMIPAGPSETVRIVLRGGLEVNGEVLPEGTSVGTSSWSLSHDEESFRDPWVFRPERWIMDESNGVSAEDVARAQAAFFPFSIGPVYCPGQKLARLILLVMIAKTLYRLEVTIDPGNTLGAGADHLGWGMRDKNVFQVKDALFSLRDGPIVQFWNRKIG